MQLYTFHNVKIKIIKNNLLLDQREVNFIEYIIFNF